MNWALTIWVLALVLAFQSSAALRARSGCGDGLFIITTLLYVYVARRAGASLPRLVVLATVVLVTELLVFGVNLTKLVSGAERSVAAAAERALHPDEDLVSRVVGW